MIPVRRDGYKFRQDICIPCYQTDSKMALKPAAFMDLAQEIAYWAAEELGFGYDSLHVHHTAWVLSRLHIRFHEAASWRDQVSLFTWHKRSEGLFYLRDFQLKTPEGKILADATSSWVVIDEQTRRLVRPEELQERIRTEPETDDAIGEPAAKVVLPAGDLPPCGAISRELGSSLALRMTKTHLVAYSDLDMIGHTNNARYVVWAMDCLPPEVTEKPVKDLCINFNKETRQGEEVELFRLQDGDAWYVEGRVDGKSCFTVKMEF